MKSLRLLAFGLLACAAVLTVSVASAGSSGSCSMHAKGASATTASVAAHGGCTVSQTRAASTGAACTRDMAAQCTPEMREACAKNPKVAAAMGCDPNGAHATTASAGGKCDMKGAAASSGECSAHATTASAGGKCDMKGTSSAAGMVCKAHLSSVAHDCDACEEWLGSDKDVRSIGGKVQVVSLKNGVMLVYTAEKASDVRSLQSAVAKRNEQLTVTLSDASHAKLCDDCKHIRGAVASGKLHREVVNIERGCMTLITSDDRVVVQRIRSMSGQTVAMR